MLKQRETGFVMIILEPALSRIKNEQCPVCGKPKSEWNRRTDWRCCSCECTNNFEKCCIIRDWTKLRKQIFERDDYKCVKCGLSFLACDLIGDHIKPIALGGDQWDKDNIQTLCLYCNKIKTAEDAKDIAELRAIEKKQINNKLLMGGYDG